MKTFQVSGILLICLYILHNQGYYAKSLRYHHERHDHGKVPQQDYPKTGDLTGNYLAVAKLSGYITRTFKNVSSGTIKKTVTALPTEDKLEYSFFPSSTGEVQFKVRADNDADIGLSCDAEERDPIYEVFIGGSSNARSVIRKNRTEAHVAEVETPGILNGSEFRGFWVRWSNGTISAGNEGESTPFLGYTDADETLMIEYAVVRTGWGASGSWIINPPQIIGMSWVAAADGTVPLGAYVAGEENGEPMYIIRAMYEGNLIPGKLVPSQGTSYVPWRDEAHPSPSYEVLCYFDGNWQECSEDAIPSNAIVAGKCNQLHNEEPLYVCRATLNGSLAVGKAHASYKNCFIPSDGKEIAYKDYEIMVS